MIISLHINQFSVFTFTPISVSVYAVVCPFIEGIYYPRTQFRLATFSMYLHEQSAHCYETILDEYYIDDTGLYLGGHDLLSVQYDFQCDLDAIQAWLCVNLLQFNVCSQSVVLLIGTRQI